MLRFYKARPNFLLLLVLGILLVGPELLAQCPNAALSVSPASVSICTGSSIAVTIGSSEVNIGYIENKSKPWEALGKMSKEVSRAIIRKAHGHTAELTEEEVSSLETINREMNKVLKEELASFHKMIIFDMDDTILKGRFINECAKKFGFFLLW